MTGIVVGVGVGLYILYVSMIVCLYKCQFNTNYLKLYLISTRWHFWFTSSIESLLRILRLSLSYLERVLSNG